MEEDTHINQPVSNSETHSSPETSYYDSEEKKSKLTRGSLIAYISVGVVLAVILGGICGAVAGAIVYKTSNGGNGSVTSQSVKVVNEESAIVSAVSKANPSVVSIIISQDLSKVQQNPFGGMFPSQQNSSGSSSGSQQTVVGGGTGFIVSSDGLILTNKHVVSIQDSSYTVIMNDGTQYPAQVVGEDPTNDIALIKINKTGLTPLPLGSSANLTLGQTVIAIGNALGEYQNTVDQGIVSGLQRTVTASDPISGSDEQLSDVIQTDAAINRGNSGGPLLNIDGQVIGMNTAVATDANNIGFALPIDVAKSDILSYQKTGKIIKPELGVRYEMVDAGIAKSNNLAYTYGAWITNGGDNSTPAVVPNSPASQAGLQANDIILEVDGTKVQKGSTLSILISSHSLNDTVQLKVYHNGKIENLSVKLTMTATGS